MCSFVKVALPVFKSFERTLKLIHSDSLAFNGSVVYDLGVVLDLKFFKREPLDFIRGLKLRIDVFTCHFSHRAFVQRSNEFILTRSFPTAEIAHLI